MSAGGVVSASCAFPHLRPPATGNILREKRTDITVSGAYHVGEGRREVALLTAAAARSAAPMQRRSAIHAGRLPVAIHTFIQHVHSVSQDMRNET